jgi:hypothetical protein
VASPQLLPTPRESRGASLSCHGFRNFEERGNL